VRALSVRRRVHFRRVERHDRFGGGQKPEWKVTEPARVRCYSRTRRRPVVGPRKTACAVGGGLRWLVRPFDLRGLLSVSANCGCSVPAVGRCRPGVSGESVGYLSDPS
jgi:hypothetical protein